MRWNRREDIEGTERKEKGEEEERASLFVTFKRRLSFLPPSLPSFPLPAYLSTYLPALPSPTHTKATSLPNERQKERQTPT
ncbi:hypothetical protein E2C01_099258 [Portunus trituberculatus]|uniref:Uncharacterized protein n=1 Tax=Portunus trituberculatus TaxID=210409 RepID=A0A5B7K9W3_PORTR|nr:hypothetical protein [Portunus trituberculatus]